MKTFIVAAALAAAIASPALAQTSTRQAQPQQSQSQYDQPIGAQSRSSSGNAVFDRQYLGADPDPNVRLDLRRDYEGSHN
jgi:opacity protein-like surface antigen